MSRIFYILFMSMLVSFAPAATDIYLSSMPIIQKVFRSSNSNIQLTLSLFFIGFAFSQLFWGPISDSFGRKKIAFIGISIFVLASVLCALSNSIQELIFYRILQSIGACSGIVIGISFIRDKFSNKNEMSKVLGYVLSAMMITPMIAPILGGYILNYSGWRANFYFLATYGVILLLGLFIIKESHPKKLRTSINPQFIIKAYILQLKNRNFVTAQQLVN